MAVSNSSSKLPLIAALGLSLLFGLGACGGSNTSHDDSPGADSGVIETGVIETPDAGVATDGSSISNDATLTDVVAGDQEAGRPACTLTIAGTLQLPTSTVMGKLHGPSMNMTTSCTTDLGTQGPEAVYLLDVPQRTGVILQTTSSTNTVIAIRRVCDDATTEVGCNNDGPTPPNANLRAILDPGSYYVLVDVYAFGIGGDFTLSLETFTPPPNGTCSGAVAVSNGSMVKGDLANGAPAPIAITCAGAPPFSSNVLYYKATIPVGNKLVATVNSMSGPFLVDVLDTCASSTCLSGGSNRAAYANTGMAPRDVILAVISALPPLPPGPQPGPQPPSFPTTFELDVTIQPLASNATCATATPVVAGMTVNGDPSFGGADTTTACAGFGPPTVSGPLWYSVSIPAGRKLSVDVTANDPFALALGVLDKCGAGAVCLTPMDKPMPSPGRQLRYANAGSSPQNVLFYVGYQPFAMGGPFSFKVAIDVLAPNGSCSMAVALTDGVPVTGDTNVGSTGPLACLGPLNSGLLYYSITIPTGMTLGAQLKPTTQSDEHVAILDSCGATTCLGTQDFGPTPTSTYTNTSGAPRPVIVVASSGFTGGPFSLTAALRGPPTNGTCSAATAVTNGTSLTFQDATGATDNLAAKCNAGDTAGVVYYKATIGAGQAITVNTSSNGSWMPAIRLLASCGAASCLATSNFSMMMKTASTLKYTNSSGAPLDVIIAVGPSAMFGPMAGYFDIDVTIGAP